MNLPKITDELKEAYQAYAEATANKKKIANHLNPLLDAKLLEMDLRVESYKDDAHMAKMMKDEIGNKITKQDDVYLAGENEGLRYYRACHEIYKKEGYEVELYHCPISISRSKEVEAEHKFIDAAMYLIDGIEIKREDLNNNLNAREEFIGLTLDLVETALKEEIKK